MSNLDGRGCRLGLEAIALAPLFLYAFSSREFAWHWAFSTDVYSHHHCALDYS